MSNNLRVGPQVTFVKEDVVSITPEEMGFTAQNCNIIYCFDPFTSHIPGRELNGLEELVGGMGLLIDMKQPGDFTEHLMPPFASGPDVPVAAKYLMAGANQTISLANAADFNFSGTTPFAIAFRAKMADASSVFYAGRSTNSAESFWVGMGVSAGVPYVGLLLKDVGGTAYIFNRDNGGDGVNAPLEFNVYYDVVINYDGAGDAKIFIDTADRTVENGSGVFASLPQVGTFKIGQNLALHSTGTTLDQFGVTNRQLSPAEILERNNGGSPKALNDISTVSDASIIAYYDFNNNLLDFKGTHNGTATTPQYTTD